LEFALREFGLVPDVDRGRRPSIEQGQKKGLSYEESGFIVGFGGWVVGNLRNGGGHGNQGPSGTTRTSAVAVGCGDQRSVDDGL
jgi:hypothetical protein